MSKDKTILLRLFYKITATYCFIISSITIESLMCAQLLSRVQLFEAPRTLTCQTPLSMEFCKQEYWSGLPFPTPRDLPWPGIKTSYLMSPALAGIFFTNSITWKAPSLWDSNDFFALMKSGLNIFDYFHDIMRNK